MAKNSTFEAVGLAGRAAHTAEAVDHWPVVEQ